MKHSLILTYHNIDSPPKYANLSGLYVKPFCFKMQMFYLKQRNINVLNINDIYAFKKTYKTGIAITFDDAYLDFYENAYEILIKYNFPVHVFVVTDRAGKYNMWDYERLNVKKRLLDWDKIREISDMGVNIGSHTKTHPSLIKIAQNQLIGEIMDSKKIIEDKLGRKVDCFCYPYGDFNDKVKDIVKEAGYKYALTTKKGAILDADDPHALSRISIKKNTNIVSFVYKIHTNYDLKTMKKDMEDNYL
ncbi:MAG: polysaccharide deacetylase family protein [Candidatus Magnetoovum sp. WYHC-5]|nr:polysaccharide deacetylase family protein [Candidatus Magnetoovum sp. WYHC-5]